MPCNKSLSRRRLKLDLSVALQHAHRCEATAPRRYQRHRVAKRAMCSYTSRRRCRFKYSRQAAVLIGYGIRSLRHVHILWEPLIDHSKDYTDRHPTTEEKRVQRKWPAGVPQDNRSPTCPRTGLPTRGVWLFPSRESDQIVCNQVDIRLRHSSYRHGWLCSLLIRYR